MRTLIAIPVFNEQRSLQGVLASVRAQLAGYALASPGCDFDLLAIDDGSTDATPAILDAAAAKGDLTVLRHQVNRGYGASLIDAFAYARRHEHDWVVTIDCDEQHEPRRLPTFFDRQRAADAARAAGLDAPDILSGSRYLQATSGTVYSDGLGPTSASVPPPDRRAINLAITAEINHRLAIDPPLTDAFCGFKSHRVAALGELELTETGYAFPMQLWPQAVAMGLRVQEVPVELIYKDLTRSFGPALSNPAVRLKHYRCTLHREIARLRHRLPALASAVLGACD
jgi:dolichol-phosphate mannosyltransferase